MVIGQFRNAKTASILVVQIPVDYSAFASLKSDIAMHLLFFHSCGSVTWRLAVNLSTEVWLQLSEILDFEMKMFLILNNTFIHIFFNFLMIFLWFIVWEMNNFSLP